MDAGTKFHGLVTTLTVLVMYAVMVYVVPRVPAVQQALSSPAGSHAEKAVALAAGGLGSVGVYQTIAAALRWLFNRLRWVRRLVLGPAYLEGTWIGRYLEDVNGTDEKRWTVEHFEQTLEGLVIRGYSFDANGKEVANWASQATLIEAERGKLTYSYTCKKHPNKEFSGLAEFNFQRPSVFKAPTELNGFAADLTDGLRDQNRERKLSNEQVDVKAAFESAKKAIP